MHGEGKSPCGSGREAQSEKVKYRIYLHTIKQTESCGLSIPGFLVRIGSWVIRDRYSGYSCTRSCLQKDLCKIQGVKGNTDELYPVNHRSDHPRTVCS